MMMMVIMMIMILEVNAKSCVRVLMRGAAVAEGLS